MNRLRQFIVFSFFLSALAAFFVGILQLVAQQNDFLVTSSDYASLVFFYGFSIISYLAAIWSKASYPEMFVYTTMGVMALKLLAAMGLMAYYVYAINIDNLHFALVFLAAYFLFTIFTTTYIFKQMSNSQPAQNQ